MPTPKVASKAPNQKRKTTKTAKAEGGTPSRAPKVLYSEALAQKVFAELAAGTSLRQICSRSGMPAIGTFMKWLAKDDEIGRKLKEQYARAREAQAETIAEDILAIADEECTMVRADKHGTADDGGGKTEVVFDATAVARNRLRVDARKWLLSKMVPKKYGDKIQAEHTGAGGAPIAIASTVTFVQPPAYTDGEE